MGILCLSTHPLPVESNELGPGRPETALAERFTMNPLSNDNRQGSRRRVADRRSVAQLRSGHERRVMLRREIYLPVEVGRRFLTERRTSVERRELERRAGLTRRFIEQRQDTDSKRILVVDGEETVRGGLRRVITGAGHEVVEAHEGHAGLAFCSETPVDVVVVNLTLPDMDGVEFIRRLRHGCPRAKVVAIAGRRPYGARDPLAIVTRLAHVRGLRWPFAPDGLLSAVREVLEAKN